MWSRLHPSISLTSITDMLIPTFKLLACRQILRFNCVLYLYRVTVFSTIVTRRYPLPLLNVSEFTIYLGLHYIIKIVAVFLIYCLRPS
jgi:hypothetical protein